MQGNRERHRQIRAEPVHHWHDARRGQRDAPARQAVRVVVEHQSHGRHDGVVVEQRLAHAHHHDVRDDPLTLAFAPHRTATRRAERGAQREFSHTQLANDFAGCEIA